MIKPHDMSRAVLKRKPIKRYFGGGMEKISSGSRVMERDYDGSTLLDSIM